MVCLCMNTRIRLNINGLTTKSLANVACYAEELVYIFLKIERCRHFGSLRQVKTMFYISFGDYF